MSRCWLAMAMGRLEEEDMIETPPPPLMEHVGDVASERFVPVVGVGCAVVAVVV